MRFDTKWLPALSVAALVAQAPPPRPVPSAHLAESIVYTRIPVRPAAKGAARWQGAPTAIFGEGGRIVLRNPDGAERNLTEGFDSAADPEVSFDGKRILFAGKRQTGDRWDIFEMHADGSEVRQITRDLGNCRQPVYLSAIFYLNDPAPVHQVGFVSDEAGELNESGGTVATNLYAARLDGSAVRRLTYNVSSSTSPAILPDGRILFSSWLRMHADRGERGRVELSGVHIDGADYAAFSGMQGARVKHMAAVTPARMVVFVEGDSMQQDGSGRLATISLRRNLKSYKPLTTAQQGLFHSPSPLPDGSILVSHKTAAGTHGVYRMRLDTGRLELLFDDPKFHEIQAKALAPRAEPDGHSSVVDESDATAKLYCLNVSESDLGPKVFPPGLVKRIRVLEGLPRKSAASLRDETLAPVLQRRFLGELDVDDDGSFHLTVPASIPIQIQALDKDGMALRSSAWIWAKNKEQRGCIGCHEDGERTPENVMAKALTHAAANLMLRPEQRRTIEFTRDVAPVVRQKCASAACHGGGAPVTLAEPRAAYEALLLHVTPGRARTSELVWRIFGRNTSRAWDGAAAKAVVPSPMPPKNSSQLTADERRTIIEWIDLGAHFKGIPGNGRTAAAGGQR